MRAGDTIAAPASAPGWSGRAMIRISGPGVADLPGHVLDRLPSARGASPARLDLGGTWGTGGVPVLVIRYVAPRSYTGEDVAEILLPGNPLLVDRALARLLTLDGVRLAEPGEFSARAYLNGCLSLDQAEGVAAMICAETTGQLDAARDLMRGRTGRRYRAWVDELTTMLALVEAGIDFTDQEDVVPIGPADLGRRIGRVLRRIEAHAGGEGGRLVEPGRARVVLAGEPNAGKSTLFNALLGRTRAVVADEPGTTRDLLEEELDLSSDAPGAGRVILVDSAGLAGADWSARRDERSDTSIESQARSAALRGIESAQAVVLCDPSGRFSGVGVRAGTPVIRVRTKADLPGGAGGDVSVCALDRWNLPILRRAIADALWRSGGGAPGVPARHLRALALARQHLAQAGRIVPESAPSGPLPDAELIADELRLSLDALGELIGRVHPDDVIARVFATFCVGK